MEKIDLLQGNLEMMILRILSAEARHGWGIAQRIQILSRDALKVEEGSLYLALYRMQRKGWIRGKWGQSENNRRAKFYELTKAGRAQLETHRESGQRLCWAIGQVMSREPTDP